jgi:hypothetical protein
MVTKKRVDTIPDVEALKKLSQSLAMLDAIMSPNGSTGITRSTLKGTSRRDYERVLHTNYV